jgi:galactonate dehydratase
MKVERIQTFLVNFYRMNLVFVKVSTDSGLYGVGEGTLEFRELTVEQAIKELARDLIGKNPHNIEAFWHDAYRDSYWRGGPVLMSALSAIEMALWDIKGKDLGVPVYQLLGGKVRDSVPCYANAWFVRAKTPEEFAVKAIDATQAGFTGLKWDPFGSAWQNLTPKEMSEALDCVAAVRDAVGSQVHLLIEGHGRFNIPTAIRVGRALEEFNILFFEEPIPPDNKEGLADVRRSVPVAIAAGERLYNRYDYREFFRLGCADFIQPDVSHAGGILEVRKIAAMAEAYHIPFCPHNPIGPVANAATLQLAACTPNFYLLETMANDVPFRGKITTESIIFKDGQMVISDKPGLGIDIFEEEMGAFPYEPHRLRHYTGDLTDIRPHEACSYFNRK